MNQAKLTPGLALKYCNRQDQFIKQLGQLNDWAMEPDSTSKCDSILKLLDQMKYTQGLLYTWERHIEQKA